MKGSGCCLILRYEWYDRGTRLEGLKKTTKNLKHNSGSQCRDLSPRLPEYEAGVLTTRTRHSAVRIYEGLWV